MAKKNYLEAFQALDGAVQDDYNPHEHVLRTSSPSMNSVFGNGWGLPRGYSMALFGPPKEGKTLITNDLIARAHADNPKAVVLKYNTEMRERLQMTPQLKREWNIDPKRYKCWEANEASGIFDHFIKEVLPLIQDGLDVALLIIDSVSSIRGRKRAAADSIDKHVIGDQAQTVQDGLDMIKKPLRDHNIGLVLTCQVRAEMDKIEQMRRVTASKGQVVKMAAAWGLKHHAEYFVYTEKNRNKDSRVNLLGEPFGEYSDGTSPFKIKVKMVDSSAGPIGRKGQFTVDIHRGVINAEEEIYEMATDREVIVQAGNTYTFGGTKWTGKAGMLKAIREDKGVKDELIKALRLIDMAGKFSVAKPDDDDAAEDETETSVE